MLDDAMSRQGYVAPMTASADGAVLDGNARLETAAVRFGGVEPLVVEHDGTRPVIMVRTDIPDAAHPLARDIIVSANRIAEVDLAWDVDVLKSMQADGVDLSGLWGEDELAALLGVEPASGQTDPDDLPAERATDIKLGDLFSLGKHKLLCGDCTKAEDVARLMGDEKAALVLTDPPFFAPATHYQSRRGWQRSYADLSPLREFWRAAVNGLSSSVLPAAHWAIFCNCDSYPPFYEVMFDRVEKINTIVWDKGHVGLGRIYRHQHELILWGRSSGHYVPDDGALRADVLTHTAVPTKDRDHPVEKPAALLLDLMVALSADGDVLLEPFTGSGTTIIAAEQSGRVARAMDIEPRYVQGAIDRWESFVGNGQKALKVGEAA